MKIQTKQKRLANKVYKAQKKMLKSPSDHAFWNDVYITIQRKIRRIK